MMMSRLTNWGRAANFAVRREASALFRQRGILQKL